MHDASHYAISTKRWVNVALAYAGVAYTSPHEWTLQHVLGHHVARVRRQNHDGDLEVRHRLGLDLLLALARGEPPA